MSNGLFGPLDDVPVPPSSKSKRGRGAASKSARPAQQFCGYVQVAVEQAVDAGEGLTYGVPEAMGELQSGSRVTVPLGARKVEGVVVARLETAPEGVPLSRIRGVLSWDGKGPLLPPALLSLASWMADYYMAPLGMVVSAMLPAAVKHAIGEHEQWQYRYPPELEMPASLPAKQRAVLEAARLSTDWMSARELADVAGAKTIQPVKALATKKLLESRQETIIRADDNLHGQDVEADSVVPDLSVEQRKVLADILRTPADEFSAHLLHGVTGSGKTEVYIRLMQETLAHDDQGGIILLVPEIALTPQTVGRITSRLSGVGVAVLHSGLSSAARHAQWERLRSGEARVVIGARSAIFAPFSKVSLLLVDEEHDSGYKQDQVPRYQARDVAIYRAWLEKARVVMGSATPSLESLYNAQGFRPEKGEPVAPRVGWHLHQLRERVPGARLPRVEVVDLHESRRERKGIHLITRRFEQMLSACVKNGHQAIVLLNRRGYANWIACPDHNCGWQLRCDHCEAGMVYHKRGDLPLGGVVRCHHCTASSILPVNCPVCSKKVVTFGLGTQRVEEELQKKFPEFRSLRMDGDTMRSASDYKTTLQRFREGGADVLLGTQMIAKGLDFPRVAFVGVICADTSLNMPDFRATERTYQLISQVAGRAGRSNAQGQVLIQSFEPNALPVQCAIRHDYDRFAREELNARYSMALPPVGRLVRLVSRHKNPAKAEVRVAELSQRIQSLADKGNWPLRVIGPMPCALARHSDYFRFEVQVFCQTAVALRQLCRLLRSEGVVSRGELAIDVDPVSLL